MRAAARQWMADDGSTMKANVRHSYEEKEKTKTFFHSGHGLALQKAKKDKHRDVAFAYYGARLAHGSYSPD
eukprot:5948761-Ditylum_brightwellii.AAC.1